MKILMILLSIVSIVLVLSLLVVVISSRLQRRFDKIFRINRKLYYPHSRSNPLYVPECQMISCVVILWVFGAMVIMIMF